MTHPIAFISGDRKVVVEWRLNSLDQMNKSIATDRASMCVMIVFILNKCADSATFFFPLGHIVFNWLELYGLVKDGSCFSGL